MLKQHNILFPVMILIASLLLGCAGTNTQESTGEYLDDSAITAKVKSAFVSDKKVSALDIQVVTFKGVVQLSGFASSQQEIDRADELVRNIQGVKLVENDIQLK
jgi:osmotically-inducible protein OsmY